MAICLLLTIVKSLPLAYNRDLQEDKPPVFDAVDNIKMCLQVAGEMTENLEFVKENALKSLNKGFVEATEIADYLARKGVAFRTAHAVVKQIVSYALKNSKTLSELTISEYKNFSKEIEKDVYKFIDVKNIVEAKTSYGGTSRKSSLKQIEVLKRLMK